MMKREKDSRLTLNKTSRWVNVGQAKDKHQAPTHRWKLYVKAVLWSETWPTVVQVKRKPWLGLQQGMQFVAWYPCYIPLLITFDYRFESITNILGLSNNTFIYSIPTKYRLIFALKVFKPRLYLTINSQCLVVENALWSLWYMYL